MMHFHKLQGSPVESTGVGRREVILAIYQKLKLVAPFSDPRVGSVISMKLISALFTLMLITAGTAVAQDDTATLVGRVTDSQHAVIPGATIMVRDVNSDARRTAATDKQGEYTVADLPPGTYDVTISKPSFKEDEQPMVTLETGQTARFDATLVVGAITEIVTVTTKVGALNTETSDKGDTVSPLEISEMPLDGRDFNDLVFNIAGISPAEEGTKGSEFVGNGVRSDQTNIVVDGINNTNPRDGTAEAAPPLDSLEEFKVQTSGYSAEYGRVAGPVVNLTIKKGGNVLKGSFFEFVRNDLFDAGNYFDVPNTKSELRRNQFGGTIGGPVSIPHLYNGHDKTFFLLSEESYRQVQGMDAIGIVPSLEERMGNFADSYNTFTGVKFNTPLPPTTPGGPPLPPLPLFNPATGAILNNFQLPSSSFDPTALLLMNSFYPLPTPQYSLPGANNYIVNEKGYTYWDNVVIKIDQQLAAHDEASIKYLFRHEHTLKPFASVTDTIGAGNLTGDWGSIKHNVQTIVAFNETHIFNPTLINDFRTGLTRNVNNEHALDAGTDWGALLGIPGGTTVPSLEQFPYFNIDGYETLGDTTQQPEQYTSNNYDTNDTITYSKGKHTAKFGVSMLRVQYIQPTNTEFSGELDFNGKTVGVSGGKNSVTVATAQNGFFEFLAGAPSGAGIRIGAVSNHLHDTNYATFAQDDYKVSAGLTLNLGLRFELETLPYEENNQFSNFIPSLNKAVLAAPETPAIDAIIGSVTSSGGVNAAPFVGFANQLGYPRTLIFPNHNRFAPRAGFAFRPSLNDQLVIRGGYGIFFTGSRLSVIRTELAGQFPFSIVESNCDSQSIPTALTGCSPRFSTVNGYDPHAASSYVQSYNLTFERALPKGMAMEVAYVGSKGTHLGRQYDINQRNPAFGIASTKNNIPTFARPYSGFFTDVDFFSFNAYSNYNAGTATLRKRFEHGLLFRLNFTWARSLDLSSGLNYAGKGGFNGAQNSQDPDAEYGRSDSDRKFVLNGNFVYLLPFHRNFYVSGWEMAGSVQGDSGTPLTPQLSGPVLDDGVATRPNRVCNGALAHPSVNLWFNTACFPQVPATSYGIFGNSGRNIITGPKLVVIDLSLSRNFRITDKTKLQFRWEVFNVPNHPNFNTPNDFVDQADVGTITSAKDPRVMQLGAKYQF
jgi:outer membrane receptor protein involved in Fe transport